MLKINPVVMTEIAEENGWVHTSGRLAGTINARKMADGLGVAVSTVTRAYDSGATGLTFVEVLHESSGRSLDDILMKAAA